MRNALIGSLVAFMVIAGGFVLLVTLHKRSVRVEHDEAVGKRGTYAPPPAEAPPIEITTADIHAAYEQNELEADQRFIGKKIQTFGVLHRIATADTGLPFIALADLATPTPIGCYFTSANLVPPGLKVGDVVTVQGVGDSAKTMLALDDCRIVK